MITKEWLELFAEMTTAECREVGQLLLGMKGKDGRDSVEEAQLREHINSLPGRPDNGFAETLKQARLAANETRKYCQCGAAEISKDGEQD